MSTAVPTLLALLFATSVADAPTKLVDGRVDDALHVRVDGRDEVWLTLAPNVDDGPRELLRLDAATLQERGRVRAPNDATFVDACPGGAGDVVVLADPRGASSSDGARLVDAASLFAVADPSTLAVGDLCGKTGDGAGELRLPIRDGLAVARAGGPPSVLAYKHAAKAYSGRASRGLRPDRAYAEALSLYAPRFFDADVDGDRRTDLVAVREGRLQAWLRGADGGLARAPAATRDLARTVGAPAEADLRVRVADVDGDGRGDAVVGVTEGAVPEKSEAWLVPSTARGLFDGAPRLLWRKEGLLVPLDVVVRQGRAHVVAAGIDTSLVSLSTVVVTGRLDLRVALWRDGASRDDGSLVLSAALDVRGGRMGGAMPVTAVDFDGDGRTDLLDLAQPGRAALHLGVDAGYASSPATTWSVPAFHHVVPMPRARAVLLIGAPRKGKTTIAVLRPAAGKATAPR